MNRYFGLLSKILTLFLMGLPAFGANQDSIKKMETISIQKISGNQAFTFHLDSNHSKDQVGLKILNKLDDLNAKLKCDQAVEVHQTLKKTSALESNFKIYNSDRNGERISIIIKNSDTHCQLKLNNLNGEEKTITIAPEAEVFPKLQTIRDQKISCTDKTEKNKNTSCEMNLSSTVDFLGEPKSAFNSRFEALLGYPISTDDIEKRNPRMPLDFSRAPKLDLIVISSLLLNNDFFGNLLARSLIYHAQQGASVRIYLSQLFVKKKDLELVEKLQVASSNIKVQFFDYKPNPLNPHDVVNNVHRNMHVKVFLTYSSDRPEDSTMIVGGRNLSDTYFYSEKPDDSKYPELVRYGTFSHPFAYFDDLDFRVRDYSLIKTMARQMLDFIEYDHKEMNFREMFTDPSSIQKESSPSMEKISYQISAPYLDDRALEQKFIELILSAKTRIRILSPYIRFTKDILQAFQQAQKNGVQIQIVTTQVLDGDIVPGILKISIQDYLNKIYQTMEVYRYYRDPTGIMHAKAFLIDDQVLALGSVNLNRRSFAHDQEISFYISGEKTIQDFNQLFEDRYLKSSNRMTKPFHINPLYKPMLKLLGNTI